MPITSKNNANSSNIDVFSGEKGDVNPKYDS